MVALVGVSVAAAASHAHPLYAGPRGAGRPLGALVLVVARAEAGGGAGGVDGQVGGLAPRQGRGGGRGLARAVRELLHRHSRSQIMILRLVTCLESIYFSLKQCIQPSSA